MFDGGRIGARVAEIRPRSWCPGSVAIVSVAVVVDSTGYLLASDTPDNLTVVPLAVIVDGHSYAEGIEITPAQVAAALRRHAAVSTSQVSPGQFEQTYKRLVARGASEIVSIHLSGQLSGTYHSAVSAGRHTPVPVTVLDSRTVGLALGICARNAALMAADGANAEQIAIELLRRARASRTWLVVDSLEQLRRGGRIGAAQALLGSALLVKPILEVVEGQVQPLEKHRTTRRAVDRMAEVALAAIGDRPVDVAVQHVAAEDAAYGLATRLGTSLPKADIPVVEVGAVIAAHVGLGTLSIAVVPR